MDHQRIISQTDDINPAGNLAAVKATVEAALAEAGQRKESVSITAVSKQHDIARISPVIAAGHRSFGENRVQEAMGKWPEIRASVSDIELRLIGPLQSNKAREAVQTFDVIETIDREKILRAVVSEMRKQQKSMDLFVQVNIGEEPQKSGIPPSDLDEFMKFAKSIAAESICGLMCIPPADEPPAPYFALLAKFAKRHGLTQLSMGMSNDYEVAVALGATHIRVGSAIFGPRDARGI